MLFIADMTLREAAGKTECVLGFKEKIDIVKLLDGLKVDVIEFPPFSGDKADALLVRTLSSTVKYSALSVAVGITSESIDEAWNSVKNAAKPRLHVILPTSAVQMEYMYHKKPAAMLELIKSVVSECAKRCNDVEFSAEDATRSDMAFLCEAINAAIDAGAKTITLCDTDGTASPEEIEEMFKYVSANTKSCILSAQCNSILDMSSACAYSALKSGAVQIKTTVNKTTLPTLTSLNNIIITRGVNDGITTGMIRTEIQKTAQRILRLMNNGLSSRSYEIKHENTEQSEIFDKKSDIAVISEAVKKLGYELTQEDNAAVFEAFTRVVSKKDVSIKELEAIVASTAMQVPVTYKLKNYVINSGNLINTTASIVLEKNGNEMQGVAMGNGSIDAAIHCIEQIVGHHYELDDFLIQAVTEGKEAVGTTLVRLRSQGKLYSGSGVSTDIIGSGIRAYINALNKIVYEDK